MKIVTLVITYQNMCKVLSVFEILPQEKRVNCDNFNTEIYEIEIIGFFWGEKAENADTSVLKAKPHSNW